MVTEGYHRGANLALIGYQHKIAAQALADRLGLGTVRYVTTTGQDVQTWEVAQRR
jgi:hypothetical protein